MFVFSIFYGKSGLERGYTYVTVVY